MPQTDRWKDGLVGYWSFNGKDMNFSAANEVLDRSGNSNDGDLISMDKTSVIPGIIGQALSFDGESDYVQVARSASLEPTNITLEAWIKPYSFPSTGNVKGIVHKRNESSPYSGYYLQLWNEAGTQKLSYVNQMDSSLKYAHSFVLGQWQHVAVTHQGTTGIMYINGVQVATAVMGSTLTNDTTKNFFIGLRPTTAYFAGFIDEVRVYNRALSAGEILEQYLAGKK